MTERDVDRHSRERSGRSASASSCTHPLLRAWREYADLLERADGVTIEQLQRRRVAAIAADACPRPRFCAQDATLLADGLHYETRIAERDVLATRERNPHDLFNALIWLRHAQLKHALNRRQVADIARVGPKERTRGQCALTHFDEAGAIVWLADSSLLASWDAHDWHALFFAQRAAWGAKIAVTLFGHALIEHVWKGNELPVAKAIAVHVPMQALAAQCIVDGAILPNWPNAEAFVAAAIADGRLLADPQELRPLPLAGIPGWHRANAQADFFHAAPCFRPLRTGRLYPSLRLSMGADQG